MIARPKLLQAGILGCVPTERSRVDDEDRLANVIGKLDVRTLEPRKRKGAGGDAGHGGRVCEDRGGEGSGEKREDASAIGEHDLPFRRWRFPAQGSSFAETPRPFRCYQ